MICTKEITIRITAPCSGLADDAAWTYNPNLNPGQPPAAVTLTYDFEGYYGEWTAVRNGGAVAATIIQWKVLWTSVAGKTLRVRSTIVGSVTRSGSGSTVRCRANANGNIVTNSQTCLAGETTAINLESIAYDPTLGGINTFIDITHDVPSDQIYSLSGIVEVACYTP